MTQHHAHVTSSGKTARGRGPADRTAAEVDQLLSLWSDLILTVDFRGRILRINEHGRTMLGYEPEELVGRNVRVIVHPEDSESLERMGREAMLGKWSGPVCHRFVRKDGSTGWLEWNITVLREEQKIIGVGRDVTPLRQLDLEYRQSRRFSRFTLDSLPLHIAVLDEQGRILTVNRAWADFARAHNFGPVNWAGLDYVEVLTKGMDSPRDVVQLTEGMKAVRSGAASEFTMEYPGQSPSEKLWFVVHLRRYEADGLLRFLAIHEDVSNWKDSQALMAGQKQVLEMIARGAALPPVLESLCRLLEGQLDSGRCAVMLLDKTGTNLTLGAAPNLPEAWRQHLASLPVGQRHGSCGTAVLTRRPVIVVDIEADPLWDSGRAEALANGLKASWSVPILATDGAVLGTLAVYYATPYSPLPREMALISTYTDLAGIALERRRAEEALKEQQELYRLVANNASDLVALHGADGRFLFVSPSWTAITGYSADDLIGHSPYEFMHPEDLPHMLKAHERRRRDRQVTETFRLRTKSGEYIWLETLVQSIRDEHGRLTQLQTASRNITERKAFEQQLHYQAFHDRLTGLANRVSFEEQLRAALNRSRGDGLVAVLFLDLDNFKVINDSLGHEVGDQLLVEVSRRLRQALNEGDVAARFGGDEFTVMLEGPQRAAEAAAVAERIAGAMQLPFVLGGVEVFVTFSIGIAVNTAENQQPERLLRSADLAMYSAKHAGKACYKIFDPAMYAPVRHRLVQEADLRRALKREELCLYYQPLVDLKTGRIAGVEALVRWQHPERGMVPPGEFIALAEETGLILPLGRWVLTEACRQVQIWQQRFPSNPPLVCSVNLSAREFQQPDLVRAVAEVISRTGLPPGSLRVEITESVLMQDVDAVLRTLEELKALGVKLAIDDFGTGYSSLAYLWRFPVDVLKIDRSFVRRIGEDSGAAAILEAVTSLGKALRLSVYGEGVETAQQAEYLRSLGWSRAQGYWFAKPLPAAEMEKLLEQNPRW